MILHDFKIYYCKNKLNFINESSCYSDYVAEEDSDTAIIKLMSMLWNKLVFTSPEVCEQESVQDNDSCAISLIQAVLLQAIIWLVVRLIITCCSVNFLEQKSFKDEEMSLTLTECMFFFKKMSD